MLTSQRDFRTKLFPFSMTGRTKSAQQVCDYYPVYTLNRIYNSPHVTGNPVSGIREIYACGIRNAAYFCCEIRNPGRWNPVHNSRNLESGVRVPLRKNPKSNALLDSFLSSRIQSSLFLSIIQCQFLLYCRISGISFARPKHQGTIPESRIYPMPRR